MPAVAIELEKPFEFSTLWGVGGGEPSIIDPE